MKIFVDSANLLEIEEALERGFPAGITTNPSILAKEEKADFREHINKIIELVLRYGYDIILTPADLRWPLHQYHFSEFTRTTDKDNTSFFGFITSKRSLSSNLVVLALTCTAIYYGMPRFGLLRAVYANTALTTTALLFGFLLADQGIPLVLKSLVCLLSRLRVPAMFIGRRVRA